MKMKSRHWSSCPLMTPPIIAAALTGYPNRPSHNHSSRSQTRRSKRGRSCGGATRQITAEVRASRGFLPQPELLQAGGPREACSRVPQPKCENFHLPKYYAVCADRPKRPGFRPERPSRRSSGGNGKRVLCRLYNALKGKCTMVRTASPNTISLRFALVDAKIPDAAVNTVATYAPYASTAYSVTSRVFNKGVGYLQVPLRSRLSPPTRSKGLCYGRPSTSAAALRHLSPTRSITGGMCGICSRHGVSSSARGCKTWACVVDSETICFAPVRYNRVRGKVTKCAWSWRPTALNSGSSSS